jgi:hypothetical protein
LDGAYLAGTNVVTGTLGINGGGMASASPLTVTGSGVLDFNGDPVSILAPLTNSGTIYWSGGTLTLANNAGIYTGAIYNRSGGFFIFQNDQGLASSGYGFELVNNAGTVRKAAGLGVSTILVPFTNSGTVDAQSGTIRFNAGGNIGGTYNTVAGATIEFNSGNYTATGTVTVTGSGICRQNGVTVKLNDSIPGFVLASGNVMLSPTFQTNGAIHNLQLDGAILVGTNVVTGTLGFNGGGILSASPLTVAVGGVLNFNGAAVTVYAPLTNFGTINWSGSTLSIANNASLYTGAIYNRPGGLFLLQSDQALSSSGYGFELFNNAGILRKTAGVGVSTFSVPFTNSATVDAQSGTIRFSAGGNLAGTYNTASGAFIEFNTGTFTENGAVSITGSGVCRQNGATILLNDRITNFILANGNVVLSPTFEGSGAIQNLQLDGAYLLGTNRVTGTLGMNGGGLASASPLTIAGGGVLNFNGASITIYSPLTNSGTVNWSAGALSVANNAAIYTGAIYNQPAGLFVVKCDQSVSSSGYGFELFNNAGTIRKIAGLGTTSFSLPLANTGVLDAQSGIIRIAGSYTQTGGTMNFGITSLAYFGQIAFSAGAPLTGMLSVNFNGNYFPSAGDSFVLLTCASRSGVFTSFALPPQAQWQTNYGSTAFTLRVLSASGQIVPITLTPVSLAGGTYTMQVNGSVGPQYIVQASTNLLNWVGLKTNTPISMPLTVTDTSAGSFPRRFYRVLTGP